MARRYQQVESSSEQHTHSSDSCDCASGGSAGKANNNNNNKRISAEGGARVGQLEEEYKKKLRQLDLKEKELESELFQTPLKVVYGCRNGGVKMEIYVKKNVGLSAHEQRRRSSFKQQKEKKEYINACG